MTLVKKYRMIQRQKCKNIRSTMGKEKEKIENADDLNDPKERENGRNE